MKLKLLILIVLLALSGCERETASPLVTEDDVVLVEVDGAPVTLPMLEYVMRQRGVAEDDFEAMRALLEELIRIRVMANAAEREGVSARPEVRAERAVRDIEIQYVRYLEHFQGEHPVTEAEIEAAYRTQLERAGDNRYRIETLAFDDQAAALRHLAALQDGQADFDELAAAGARLEQPGWIDFSQVPPDFAAALARTGQGEVVGAVLPVERELRLVRVVEIEDLEPPPFEAVRDGIRRMLTRQRSQALIDELYEAAEIEPMLPMEQAGGEGS